MKTIKLSLLFLFLIFISPLLKANLENKTVDAVQESLNLINNNLNESEKHSLNIILIIIFVSIIILCFIWVTMRFILRKNDVSKIEKYSKTD